MSSRLLLCVLVFAACRDAAPVLAPTESIPAAPVLGQRVLDVSPDGHRLVGTFPPPRPDSDERPLYVLVLDGRSLTLSPVRDARLVPGRRDALLVAEADGRLHVVSLEGLEIQAIDVSVEAGFDVNADCACVAYLAGPDFEAVPHLAALDGRFRRVLAADVAPSWLPALSPDGTTIAFVSGKSGFPALWTVRSDGTGLTQRTNVGARSVDDLSPTPEGPERPTWDGTTYRFVNADGSHAIPLDAAGPLPVRVPAIRRRAP